MELSQAKDFPKLVKTAIRTMVNDLQAHRAMVVLDEDFAEHPVPAAQYGFESDDVWNNDTVPQKVIEHVLQRGDPVYILDAQKDHKFRTENIPNRCIICVPLGKGTKRFRGFLYCDHQSPGALSHSVNKRINELANDFDERHMELKKIPKKSEEEKREVEESQEYNKIVRELKTVVFFTVAALIAILYFT